jgi:hypothetical protein
MPIRNFKIRIHNLTLKKTVFLDSGNAHTVRQKWTKYLESLGYRFNRQHVSVRHVKSYTFYCERLFKGHGDFLRKTRKYGRIRPARLSPDRSPSEPPRSDNPYLVFLEIIELNHSQKPRK